MIYRNGFREYFLMVVLFGVPMGALIGLMKMSVAVGLIAGVFSGAAFMLLMLLFVKVQEKNYAKMRAELSKQRKIICDGAATIQGTGGWMFFTEQGLEFYPHFPAVSAVSICFFHSFTRATTIANVKPFSVVTTS